MSVAAAFLAQSRAYLGDEYLPKIRECVGRLDAQDVWWRSDEASNSVGHLLLHLAGNLRQWIVAGVGGAPDTRDRQAEFSAPTATPPAELLARLEATVAEADRVLAGLSPGDLLARRTIQGRDVSVLEAVYHVVEHFGMHTGQIAYITKLRTGRGLDFYRDADGLAVPVWPGARPMRTPRGD